MEGDRRVKGRRTAQGSSERRQGIDSGVPAVLRPPSLLYVAAPRALSQSSDVNCRGATEP